MLAQLSGAVLGALLTKALLKDEGRATHYGAGQISGLLSGNFAGAVVEAIGVFVLVMVVLAVFFSAKGKKDWAPLAIGFTFVFLVMVAGPLTTACFNPARWFGAALVGETWGGAWPYLVGPLVGSLLAVGVFRFVIEAGGSGPGRLLASCQAERSPSKARAFRRARRADPARALGSAGCAGLLSPETSRCRSPGPASATASTAPSPPTRRTSTRRLTSSGSSTKRSVATPRSCWS